MNVETYGADVDHEEEPMTQRSMSPKGLAYLVLPLAVLAMALGVGYLKWQAESLAGTQRAAAPVAAASAGAATMLSYRAEHVDQDLLAASERMTGDFQAEFSALINDLVIPGAREQRISAAATVPAAALLSATPDRAEVLVYINQTTTVGDEPPTETQSSARVEMVKIGNDWRIAGFTPI